MLMLSAAVGERSPRGIVRFALAAALCSAVLIALMAAFPSPARAEPAGCAGPEGYGRWVATNASFSQRVGLNRCADVYPVGGSVGFAPTSAFNASHVTGCSVHIGLVWEGHGSLGEKTRDCTGAARLGRSWEMNTATAWTVPAVLYGTFHLTGYVNIQAGQYYGTYPFARG